MTAAAAAGMKRFNITVVFDAILRPDTTGVYVVRALRELGHNVSHYMPCFSQSFNVRR